MRPGTRTIRRFVFGLWLAAALALVGLLAVSHLAPVLGYELVIVKGPSMEPTIALGGLAFEKPARADQITPGTIVTLTAPNSTIITHRVTRVVQVDGHSAIETKGDANPAADPSPTPITAVTGIVVASLPILGFALAWLQIPSGILSVLTMLGALFTGLTLLEDLESEASSENGLQALPA